jgi:hypothetical protein
MSKKFIEFLNDYLKKMQNSEPQLISLLCKFAIRGILIEIRYPIITIYTCNNDIINLFKEIWESNDNFPRYYRIYSDDSESTFNNQEFDFTSYITIDYITAKISTFVIVLTQEIFYDILNFLYDRIKSIKPIKDLSKESKRMCSVQYDEEKAESTRLIREAKEAKKKEKENEKFLKGLLAEADAKKQKEKKQNVGTAIPVERKANVAAGTKKQKEKKQNLDTAIPTSNVELQVERKANVAAGTKKQKEKKQNLDTAIPNSKLEPPKNEGERKQDYISEPMVPNRKENLDTAIPISKLEPPKYDGERKTDYTLPVATPLLKTESSGTGGWTDINKKDNFLPDFAFEVDISDNPELDRNLGRDRITYHIDYACPEDYRPISHIQGLLIAIIGNTNLTDAQKFRLILNCLYLRYIDFVKYLPKNTELDVITNNSDIIISNENRIQYTAEKVAIEKELLKRERLKRELDEREQDERKRDEREQNERKRIGKLKGKAKKEAQELLSQHIQRERAEIEQLERERIERERIEREIEIERENLMSDDEKLKRTERRERISRMNNFEFIKQLVISHEIAILEVSATLFVFCDILIKVKEDKYKNILEGKNEDERLDNFIRKLENIEGIEGIENLLLRPRAVRRSTRLDATPEDIRIRTIGQSVFNSHINSVRKAMTTLTNKNFNLHIFNIESFEIFSRLRSKITGGIKRSKSTAINNMIDNISRVFENERLKLKNELEELNKKKKGNSPRRKSVGCKDCKYNLSRKPIVELKFIAKKLDCKHPSKLLKSELVTFIMKNC